ncbi:hypothetical protein D3C87_999000 [compost metagenome]
MQIEQVAQWAGILADVFVSAPEGRRGHPRPVERQPGPKLLVIVIQRFGQRLYQRMRQIQTLKMLKALDVRGPSPQGTGRVNAQAAQAGQGRQVKFMQGG